MRQAPRNPTTLVKIVALLVLTALAATSALAASRSARKASSDLPRATIRAASDSLSISNSQAGGAVFGANGLAPGDQATGTVTIGNTGNIAGDFALAPANLSDTPGPNGGALSAALDLTVEDLTSNTTVYNGKLNAFGQRPLGTWQPGQSRDYRFTATLPDTGIPASTTSGDNLYRGSSTSVALNWTASGEGSVTPPPPPPPPPSLKLALTGKAQKARSGRLSWTVSCSQACTVKTSGAVMKAKGKKGNPKKLLSVRVKNVSVRGGAPTKVTVKLSKKQVKKIKQALKKRNRVSLVLKATASTAGGATTTGATTLQIKR